MSTEVVAGAFALVGVLVGGLLQGVVSYALERHKQDRAARVAAWQIMAELSRAYVTLKRSRASDDWTYVPGLRLDDWGRHRDLLFGTLRLDDLLTVLRAVQAVETIVEKPPPPGPKPKGVTDFIDEAIEQTREAVDTLDLVGSYGPSRSAWGKFRYEARYGVKT